MSAQVIRENPMAEAAAQLRAVTWNLNKFSRQIMGLDPTWQQEELFDLVQQMVEARIKRHQGQLLSSREEELCGKFGISIRSGMGTGKDAAAAVIINWAMINFPRFKGMATAPTEHQLKDVLWGELGKWQQVAKDQKTGELLRELILQGDRMYMKGEKTHWFFTYKTASVKADETTQASTLRGMHEDHMFIIVDEASGVPDPVMRPIEGTLTGFMNFAIMFSQPSSTTGYFADSHGKDRASWECLHWNAEDCPRVSKDSIRRMALKYGEKSDYYLVFVKGEFPSGDPDVLIPLQWAINATRAEIIPFPDDPLLIGVDVGYGGKDESAILLRMGNVVTEVLTYNEKNTMTVANWASSLIRQYDPFYVGVDTNGFGAGTYDRLREIGYACVHPVNVSELPANEERYYRLRDELWMKLRDRFMEGTIKIPDDPGLIAEVSGIRMDEPTPDGQIKVESKKKMKARGLASPNKADALCITENAQWANRSKPMTDRQGLDEDELMERRLERLKSRAKYVEDQFMVA